MESWTHVPIALPDGSPGSCAGEAIRTGVTPPHFPELPVYCFYLYGGEVLPDYYVLDGGVFVESGEWRDAHRPPPPKPARKRKAEQQL